MLFWSNRKRYLFAFFINIILLYSYAIFFQSMSITFMNAGLVTLLALLFAHVTNYFISSELQAGAPKSLKTKGYDFLGGDPNIYMSANGTIAIISRKSGLGTGLSVDQFDSRNLQSFKVKNVEPRKIDKVMSSNLLRVYVEVKFNGEKKIQKIGFRAKEEASPLIEVLNKALPQVE